MSTDTLIAAMRGEPKPAVATGRRRWYRMHDSDETLKAEGAREIDKAAAPEWNAKGYGIFWTVNEFSGPRRIANLTRIAAWAVDIDTDDKARQHAKIMASPLIPSLVVETRRGYQVYWGALDGCAETWNAIVLDRLVPHYGGDPNARDIARILRVPGYLHQKDPANPFPVRVAWRLDARYKATQIAERYPDRGTSKRKAEASAQATAAKRTMQFAGSDDFWDRVYAMDCEHALERLSGHGAVKGERFTFRLNRSGTKNILVDGKGSSAWVDKAGHIGSSSQGGPSVYQWLRWYGNTPRECVDVLKRVFPELEAKS